MQSHRHRPSVEKNSCAGGSVYNCCGGTPGSSFGRLIPCSGVGARRTHRTPRLAYAVDRCDADEAERDGHAGSAPPESDPIFCALTSFCREPRCGYIQFARSEEHTSELQSLMRISYAVFCLKTKNTQHHNKIDIYQDIIT